MKKRYLVTGLIIIGLVLFCAFSEGGFIVGLRILGEIVNIFGTALVGVLSAFFSIPILAQEITKRVITTILVWIVFGFSLRGSEKKVAKIIMGAVASAICTFLSWIGML